MEIQQAGFWFVLGLLVLFTTLDDLLMKFNNGINGRRPEDPQGSVGCGFYVGIFVTIYIISIIIALYG